MMGPLVSKLTLIAFLQKSPTQPEMRPLETALQYAELCIRLIEQVPYPYRNLEPRKKIDTNVYRNPNRYAYSTPRATRPSKGALSIREGKHPSRLTTIDR